MAQPLISVVTISFNQAEYLERAISSVVTQSGVRIEYIVIDPGSSDGSRDIINRRRSNFSNILFEPDVGPADALNKGLALATGDIFYYLNSDDEVAPGAFSEAAEIFARHPTVDVIYGNGWIIDAADGKRRRVYSSQYFNAKHYALGLCTIVQQAAFIRTSALRRAGGFNVKNRTCWDGEAFVALARNGAVFRRVWRDWGRFRVYPTTISGSGRFEQQMSLDHARICAESGFTVPPNKFWRLINWVLLRASDWRRWPTYMKGRIRPAELAREFAA
jgi:glycosyltransferase involved in cell wall biosynthesis